ncbi:hypothetical protein MPTK1_1g28630 [Marchantia polymorpha subsp. ruderalis]|uniref:Uncharacterized protein n=2 Tax=Marchantia polymorpha TaxID=3197 RepID=A0AAF6AVA8_MARPO|nr:hypothetical protein MARPO_0002s0017 [Marchantia polymorpha]BBN00379.1 hypothetical protein Mp_1g28630 [Marchantia polymorpha subsp. ruderalis]|eukprot:PTQ49504.1 hypothetical protein MARPO_0002s0017 [Marchantia polymorpha]
MIHILVCYHVSGPASVIAGMVSAFCSGPAELTMIQQQRTEIRFFTAAYLDVNPLLQEKFQAAASFKGRHTLATVLAGVVSGSISTLITHPFDTIKTRMEANLNLQKYRTVTSTSKLLLQEGGMAAFYSGLIPRTQRIICAFFILEEAKINLSDFYL